MVKPLLRAVGLLICVMLGISVRTSAVAPGTRLDWVAPPGENYEHARFRLWYPDGEKTVRAVVVLMPGSNEDGRSQIEDWRWQDFAARHDLALVGCDLTDKPHAQMFIEAYANASNGSGQALLDALNAFAGRLDHPELANAPLLLWGMSAGGEYNYEFVAWKPDRVAGFVVNKGGVYYSALLSDAARQVPGLLFIGGKDLISRQSAIRGLFAINRRAGALWALVNEPAATHVVGASRDVAEAFFQDLIARRLGPSSDPAAMHSLAEADGFVGDPASHAVRRATAGGDEERLIRETSWLPTERVARLWQAVTKDQPLPD